MHQRGYIYLFILTCVSTPNFPSSSVLTFEMCQKVFPGHRQELEGWMVSAQMD